MEPMMPLVACVVVVTVVIVGLGEAANAQATALIEELKVAAFRYHEDAARLFTIRDGLEQAIKTDEHVDNLDALAWTYLVIGGLPEATRAERLAAYDRGRQVAKRAIELYPDKVAPHFWFAVNTGRWGQTNGVVRSLFLLPTVKREMELVLRLDPDFAPAYSLAGNVYYEVPELLGGDLNKAEELFRTGLTKDPRDTGIRLGLGKTLMKRGRYAEARRELQAILDEPSPRNVADWTLKDSKTARELLDSIKNES
jgi:tetratricopeptide (TPR) repeat protein